MSHLPHDRYVTPTTIPPVDAGVRRAPAHAAPTPAPAHGYRRFLGLTALGTLLPGSGLLLTGRRKSGGALLAAVVVIVVGAAIYLTIRGREGALALALDPTFLTTLAIGAVVALVVVVASVVWTGVITWPRPAGRWMHALATLTVGLLCAALVAPAAIGVRDVAAHRDLLTSLFNQSGSQLAGGPNPWANTPRVNVMLVGADSEDDRQGVRTDSMMLASIDTATGDTILFGLPRNLERVPFPDTSPLKTVWPNGFRCAQDCLLNDVWMEGEKNSHLYPGNPKPGLTALNEAVTGVTGLTPDYDIVVNMSSFTALVDAMGGVDITVRERVPIGGKVENGRIVPGSIRGWIEPGPRHLDGYHAMWFARGRATTDDFDRMRRQRCMVGALVRQVNPAMMLERYPAIAQVAKDNIYTNIPQQHLGAFAQLAVRMQQGTIRSLPFSNQVVRVGNPDYDLIHQMVQQAISGGPMPGESPTTGATGDATGTATRTSSPTRTATATRTSPGATPTSTTTTDGLVDVAQAC